MQIRSYLKLEVVSEVGTLPRRYIVELDVYDMVGILVGRSSCLWLNTIHPLKDRSILCAHSWKDWMPRYIPLGYHSPISIMPEP